MKPHLAPRYNCPPREIYVTRRWDNGRTQITYHPSQPLRKVWERATEIYPWWDR